VVTAPGSDPSGSDLERAYRHCWYVAREHYENFPVASFLLPARMRGHIAAIYAFARAADDFADKPGIPDDERLRLLDTWREFLANGVRPFSGLSGAGDVFLALHNTIRECRLPVSLFEDLISAFRQDVTRKRYDTWADVLDYCRRSANPVGRLVLRVAGYDDRALDESSDALCTALQLTNFWQDLERDWHIGRLYVPLEERDRAGAREADLAARRLTPAWLATLSAAAGRTRGLFARGRKVCDGVTGRLRWELRLTWLGGSRILDRLERARFDVFRARPSLGPSDVPALAWQAVRWKRNV
jgi:squalene synthase HpnC